MPFEVGDRVRFNERSVWPERVGAQGVIVGPPNAEVAGRYPWHGRGPNEVIVLLDDDPLKKRYDVLQGWSCAASRDTLDVL